MKDIQDLLSQLNTEKISRGANKIPLDIDENDIDTFTASADAAIVFLLKDLEDRTELTAKMKGNGANLVELVFEIVRSFANDVDLEFEQMAQILVLMSKIKE